MDDPLQAFAKAFRIPHLEGNSFLYGELPPSFKQNCPVRPPNPCNKENTPQPPVSPPSPRGPEPPKPQRKAEEKAPLADTSQRTEDQETQGSTARGSVCTAEDAKCCDGKLIAECRKLLEDVKKMKRRRGHSEAREGEVGKSVPSFPLTNTALTPPNPPKVIVPTAETTQPQVEMRRLSFQSFDRPQRTSVSPIPEGKKLSLLQVTREYSESIKPSKRPGSHRKKPSGDALKGNLSYLQEVYSVIEAHAHHCRNLKSDLRKLRTEYENSLIKHQ